MNNTPWKCILTPAFGMRYSNVTELRKAFYGGADFIAIGIENSSKYYSIRDIPEKSRVQIRYGRGNERITILEVG